MKYLPVNFSPVMAFVYLVTFYLPKIHLGSQSTGNRIGMAKTQDQKQTKRKQKRSFWHTQQPTSFCSVIFSLCSSPSALCLLHPRQEGGKKGKPKKAVARMSLQPPFLLNYFLGSYTQSLFLTFVGRKIPHCHPLSKRDSGKCLILASNNALQ